MFIHHPTRPSCLSLTLSTAHFLFLVPPLLRKPVTPIPPYNPDYSFKVPSTPLQVDQSHFCQCVYVCVKTVDAKYTF